MVKVILMTHSELADVLLSTLSDITGEKDFIEALSFSRDTDYLDIKKEIENTLRKHKGSKVLILTDMFGGTPTNIALSFLEQGEVEVVTGVNLPMLIKISQVGPNVSLDEMVKKAVEAGKKNIVVASEILKKKVRK